MKLFTNKRSYEREIKKINNISFVPTMGALHKGTKVLLKSQLEKSMTNSC